MNPFDITIPSKYRGEEHTRVMMLLEMYHPEEGRKEFTREDLKEWGAYGTVHKLATHASDHGWIEQVGTEGSGGRRREVYKLTDSGEEEVQKQLGRVVAELGVPPLLLQGVDSTSGELNKHTVNVAKAVMDHFS